MYIVSWLIGRPFISMWVLIGIAFLLYWSGFTNSKNAVLEDHSVVAEHSDPTKHGSLKKLENIPVAKSKSETVSTDVVRNDKIPAKDVISPINNDDAGTKLQQQVASSDSVATDSPFIGNAALPANNQLSKKLITDLNSSSKEDMLLIAREAYWNNGLDEAAEIYQKLIKLEPNVLDHKGELGNVYWRQGFPKKAAELYSDIAIPMIKDGKSEPVANMLGFIGLFYPDRAAQINDHLQAEKK